MAPPSPCSCAPYPGNRGKDSARSAVPAPCTSSDIPSVLNLGGLALLYFTPLCTASASSPVLHRLLHLHFLAAGYLSLGVVLGRQGFGAMGRPVCVLPLANPDGGRFRGGFEDGIDAGADNGDFRCRGRGRDSPVGTARCPGRPDSSGRWGPPTVWGFSSRSFRLSGHGCRCGGTARRSPRAAVPTRRRRT